MKIVCFVSGSGTNYREIVRRDPAHNYLVFTNRPGCGGTVTARENGHPVIELSHIPYLREARKTYGAGKVPRNAPERVRYEKDACRLIEERLGGQPDLVCLAGYDQWTTDWLVDRYFPCILNVHPGDTTKGYDGLHWIPAAKALLAGDRTLRSTLFIVDKGEDTGPVLVQSKPLDIESALRATEVNGAPDLLAGKAEVLNYAAAHDIKAYADFAAGAGPELCGVLEHICTTLQDALKVAGDWQIYPFAVHNLIARGRVSVEGWVVYVDGQRLPAHGYRLDEYPADR